MNSSVTIGQYLAVPFRPFEGDPTKNDHIFEGLLRLPIFPVPLNGEDRKAAIALILTDPHNFVWEVWHNAELVGIFLLTQVVRGLDADMHFAFFDRRLYGRRLLLLNIMDWCFRELNLQRLSAEPPEHLDPLVRYYRTKLGFSYEGERDASSHPTVQRLGEFRINGSAQWVAKWGSRRERAFWDGEQWRDRICLRILRGEFEKMRRV